MARTKVDTTLLTDPRPALWTGLVALIVLSILFYTVNWDLAVSSFYWNQGQAPWPGREDLFGDIAYRLGHWPALLAGTGGLIVFILSYKVKRWAKWRGPGLFLFLVLLLGPGLLVNGLGKALTGRPRPSDLGAFGGSWDYQRPWQLGIPGRGRSFPSGHASMGFYWLSLYFLWQKRWPRTGLALGLLAGALMSWARVAQGGHFLSDTLFSGVIVFIVSAALSPLLYWQPPAEFWARKKVVAALFGAALGYAFISNIIYEERSYLWVNAEAMQGPPTQRLLYWPGPGPLDKVALDLDVQKGDLQVHFIAQIEGPSLPLRVDESFGAQALPGATEEMRISQLSGAPFLIGPGTLGAKLTQELHGTMLTKWGRYDVGLPRALAVDARLKSAEGVLTIGSFPKGRQVLLNGKIHQEDLPFGFQPYGDNAWLKPGEQPQIALTLEAPEIKFEP